jgi:hypothetical protein
MLACNPYSSAAACRAWLTFRLKAYVTRVLRPRIPPPHVWQMLKAEPGSANRNAVRDWQAGSVYSGLAGALDCLGAIWYVESPPCNERSLLQTKSTRWTLPPVTCCLSLQTLPPAVVVSSRSLTTATPAPLRAPPPSLAHHSAAAMRAGLSPAPERAETPPEALALDSIQWLQQLLQQRQPVPLESAWCQTCKK